MRNYAKCLSTIWTGDTGQAMKQYGIATQLMAHYLINNPHTNMLGVYYLPVLYAVEDTGMSYEQVESSINRLCKLGFCHYDKQKKYVWVTNMATHQIGEHLKAGDNRVKSVHNIYDSLPCLDFMAQFYKKYQRAFRLKLFKVQQSTELLSQGDHDLASSGNDTLAVEPELQHNDTQSYPQNYANSCVRWRSEHDQWVKLEQDTSSAPLAHPSEGGKRPSSWQFKLNTSSYVEHVSSKQSTSKLEERKNNIQYAQKQLDNGNSDQNITTLVPPSGPISDPLRSQEQEQD